MLLREVHYSDEICGVYNGFLKSGSSEKMEIEKTALERGRNEEEKVGRKEGNRKKL